MRLIIDGFGKSITKRDNQIVIRENGEELDYFLPKDLKQIISPEEKEELQIDDDERFVLNLTIEVDSIDTSIIKDNYKEWNNVNIIIKCPNGELKLYTNYDEEKNHTETNAEEKTNDNNK